MIFLNVRQKIFLLIILIWWFLFATLSITGFNDYNLLNIIGFSFLLIVPGLLTVLLIDKLNLDLWGYFSIIIGFSLIEIIFIVLLGNMILPHIGIARPLDRPILLAEISFLIGLLIIINFARNAFSFTEKSRGTKISILRNVLNFPISKILFAFFRQIVKLWRRDKKYQIPIKHYLIFDNFLDLLFAFAPIIFVALSVMGAVMLNNGGSFIITFIMLIGIAIYCAILIIYNKRFDPNVFPIALFFISLSLLLMTSLRGWYITGHDVQREYRVFELAKNNGIWLISSFRDAYNACMSITILPTIFYNLLKFNDPYVYKIFFQIIFAIVPGIVYLIAKRYASNIIAFISTIYFISFPTFFGDMPMLNRQEIAFVFLSLMFYLIFNSRLKLFLRKTLFALFGVGMILSHYSTTYTVIALMVFLIIFRPILYRLSGYLKIKKIRMNSAVEVFGHNNILAQSFVTIWMVVFLAGASFLWSSVLTDTSSNSISRVITKTISVIWNNANEDTRSGDVLYSLFSWKKLDGAALLKEYKEKVVIPLRLSESRDIYFDASLYEKYRIDIMPNDLMPLTWVGRFFQSAGIDVVSFNYYFRQLSAKLLQFLIILGLIFVFFSKRYIKKTIDTEFILLAIGSLVLILSQILLPVLSVEYGLLRAFQQSLIFLGIYVVIGSFALIMHFSNKKRVCFAGLLAIIFFLSSTGVFTQFLGGYDPQLHLNNDGTSYDLYYLHTSEIVGIDWLNELREKDKGSVYQSEIQSDRYTSTKMTSIRQVNPVDDIYPELIRKDSYVFLGFTNVHKEKASTFYKGSLIMYRYPIQFLDDNKNLIYNSGDVKIYR